MKILINVLLRALVIMTFGCVAVWCLLMCAFIFWDYRYLELSDEFSELILFKKD